MFGDRLRNWARLFRTLRYVRPSQWRWRIAYALERKRAISSSELARSAWSGSSEPCQALDYPPELLAWEKPLVTCDWFARLAQGELELLNHAGEFRADSPDWRLGRVKTNRLWTITLHYHEWLYELARLGVSEREERQRARELFRIYIRDWLEHCALERTGARDLAWNSYAIATRIDWWIRILECRGIFESDDEPLRRNMLRSLWMQAEYLHNHIEWDLRANHLLRDAVGLARAGRFFAEPRAERWLRTAARIAVEQAEEQVLEDGGHFERSPHYHMHALEDFHALTWLLRAPNEIDSMRKVVKRMRDFLRWLRHPDGTLPLLNDSAAHDPTEIERSIAEPARKNQEFPSGSRWFKATGLVVHHDRTWTLFWDVGSIGPHEQPGHAHADTLSLECSYRGNRLFIDPGTYHYDLGAIRDYDRSTAAHNTVCLDDCDSSEVWHIFRVGRRAEPCDVKINIHDTGLNGTASHNGYRFLKGHPRHTRTVSVNASELTVEDRIEGTSSLHISGGFLLAPSFRAEVCPEGWRVSSGKSELLIRCETSAAVERSVEKRAHHADFGQEIEVDRVQWNYTGKLPLVVRFSICGETKFEN